MALSIEEQRRVLTEFIEIYKFEPCLWRIKSKEYHDRGKREAGYRKLLEKLKEIDINANRDAVVKKINNLRSNVRKEKKKYEDSIKSGASADEVYHPKLWYYHLFDFLSDQETPRKSISNLDPDEEYSSETGSIPDTQNSHVADDSDSQSRQEPDNDAAGSLTDNETVPAKRNTPRSRPRKPNQDSLTTDVLTTVQEHFKRPRIQEDRFDVIGKGIAIKLREMGKRQSLIAEKLINDVLFEAQLDNLTLQHKCFNMQDVSNARNGGMQQCQSAIFSRQSGSCSSSYSSSPSLTVSPIPSPSPNYRQYTQAEISQLQLIPQYTYQHSQQFSQTSPAPFCPRYQENQQSAEYPQHMESSKGHASSLLTNFTCLE